jgi:hypothetical protein
MTKELMSLADGKIVLVLEGGYELNALAECGKLCIEALLNRQVNFENLFLFRIFEIFGLFRYQNLVKKLLKVNLIYMLYTVYNKLLKSNVCSLMLMMK